MAWTNEELEKMRKLAREERRTLPEIAEALGRGFQEVRWQFRKMGLRTFSPGERTLAEQARVYRYSETHGVKDAAEHFKLTADVVKNIRRRYVDRVAKLGEGLDPAALVKIRRYAHAHACKRGYPSHAEDFAAYVTILKLQRDGVIIDQVWVDYAKHTFGDFTTGSGRLEYKSNMQYAEIVDEPDFDSPSPGVQVTGGDGRELFGRLKFEEIVDMLGLEGDDRVFFFLYFKWGLTMDEIGEAHGVTTQRVSQKMQKVFLTVRKMKDKGELG